MNLLLKYREVLIAKLDRSEDATTEARRFHDASGAILDGNYYMVKPILEGKAVSGKTAMELTQRRTEQRKGKVLKLPKGKPHA